MHKFAIESAIEADAVTQAEKKGIVRIKNNSLSFLAIYFLAFFLFNKIFPDFMARAYNLENITGILLRGILLEELLYALSFGLLWSPTYEYEHGEKDVDL